MFSGIVVLIGFIFDISKVWLFQTGYWVGLSVKGKLPLKNG
jgi:hypothetical protein